MENKILIIDEGTSASYKRIASALTKEGFEVVTTASCNETLLKQDEIKPALIILGEGVSLDVCEVRCRCSPVYCRLRQAFDVPIIMIDTVPGNWGWVRAVKIGFDFYLAEPYSKLELVARVRALLRRYEICIF